MIAFECILVPVDFSEPSNHALRVAVDLAKQYGGALRMLHVFDVPPAYAGMDMTPMDLMTPMFDAARRQLDAAVDGVRAEVPDASAVLGQGSPWREILAEVEKSGADLVVMGTHGRRGLDRALLGSVTEKVVRLSPVPVLTVRGGVAPRTPPPSAA